MNAGITWKTAALTAATAALFGNVALAEESIHSSDISAVGKWYGRAGGPVGSDRVSDLAVGTGPLGISYDAEVARRTNMATDRQPAQSVGVTYDQEVARRTNMQREEPSDVQSAELPGKASN